MTVKIGSKIFSSPPDVLKPFYPDCEPPNDAARMLAVCCICESHQTLIACIN
jgi:hypothetical protein